MLVDLFLAGSKSFFFQLEVFLMSLTVLVCRLSKHGTQRCHNVSIRSQPGFGHDQPVFNAPRRFHNDIFILVETIGAGIKIVNASAVAETHANNGSQ